MNSIELYRIFWLGLLISIQSEIAFSQTNTSSISLIRYSSAIKACNSSDALKILIDKKKFIYQSDLLPKYPTLLSNLGKQNSKFQAQVLDSVENWRIFKNRKYLAFEERDFKRLGHEYQLLLKYKLGTILSVGAGGDLSGVGVNIPPNTAIFISKNAQDKDCWTTDEESGGKQAFEYEGFEDVAAILSTDTGRVSCSAVIVGQEYALTARHCNSSGLLLIPTKSSRRNKSPLMRKSVGCSVANQYSDSCEFEVATFTLAKIYSEKNTNDPLSFKSPLSNTDYNQSFPFSPDVQLIKFQRKKEASEKHPLLMTAKLATYSQIINVADTTQKYSFIRAGYGKSFESEPVALTIGSWSSYKPPVSKNLTSLDEAFVAMFHSKEQKSKICKRDSGGALFWGNPNGYEANDDGQSGRLLVGILSGAQNHDTNSDCLNSLVEFSQTVNTTLLNMFCGDAGSQLNGCKK